MSSDRTTVEIGYKADTKGLKEAERETSGLIRITNRLTESVARLAQKYEAGRHVMSKVPTSVTGLARGARSIATTGALHVPRGKSGTEELPVQSIKSLVGLAGLKKIGGLAKFGGAAGAAALGAVGIGAVGAIGAIATSVAYAKQYLEISNDLQKQLWLSKAGVDQFNASIGDNAKALRVTQRELLQYQKAYSSVAGAGMNRLGEVQVVGGFARGMGMDPGVTIQQSAQLRQAGMFGTPNSGMNSREFAANLAEAINAGRMHGRESEVLSSLQQLVSLQLQTMTNPAGRMQMFQYMTALNSSGQPGLQGARGAQVLSRLSQGIQNPGGGDFGEYFLYKALGGGSYYNFKYNQEEGAFGQNNNLGRVMKQIQGFYGRGTKSGAYAASQLFGISMHQWQSLESATAGMGQGQIGGFSAMLDRATGGKATQVDPESFGFLARLYGTGGDKGKVNEVLATQQLTDEQRKKILDAGSFEGMMREAAGMNLEKTAADTMAATLSTIQDKLQSIGTNILEPTLRAVNAIARWFGHDAGEPKPDEIEKLRSDSTIHNEFIGGNGALASDSLADSGSDGKEVRVVIENHTGNHVSVGFGTAYKTIVNAMGPAR